MVCRGFEELFIEISMDEEQENGTLILDLRRKISSLLEEKNSNGYQIKFVGSCLNIYFDEKNFFKIYSNKIDREEFCPYDNNNCYLNCKILIEKQNEIKLIKLKININDINDNKPKFNKKYYLFNIENKENNSLQLEEAKDKDLSNENSIQKYYLNLKENEEKKIPFKLNYNKEKHLLELILLEKQNENEKKKFEFELIVIDGQNEKDSCLIEINLYENEINLIPEFDLLLYKFQITNLENKFIGKVQIKNMNKNEKIFYRLISSNNLYLNLFEINPNTGEIYLKNFNKNFLFDSFYELFIEGYYSNSISSLTTIHIYFNLTFSSSSSSSTSNDNDENNIQILIPKLFQNSLNENEIYLKENSSIPLTILQIFLSFSSSSSLSLRLESSIEENYFHLKQLDEQSFELILMKTLDYELIQNISLKFISNNISKFISIIILNINDCLPTLNQSEFYFQIQENNQIPFLIYTFQGYDQDNLNNLTYQIEIEQENIFSINSTNGQLWALKSFDREIISNYSFLICIFDQIYKTCSKIYLNILDENDNICLFNSSFIKLNIYENLSNNIHLIQIHAYDPDYQQNSTLFYSFSTPTSYLNINSTNGLIQTTSNSFDYEFIQSFNIEINACDNYYSFPSFCCSMKLFISIQDLNDNAPFLIYPKSSKHTFIINYSLNKTMPQLKAFDNDIFNPLIFWNIIGGTLNSSFSIDYYSGQLILLTAILPLYGTLLISISSQTIVEFTFLIHDNQTDPQLFLQSSSYQFFYIISSISLFFLLSISFLLLLYFLRQRKTTMKCKTDDDPLMNTPSTTTLSTRSISTSNHKKLYETYYSFGDSVLSPQVIHL